jgi:nucleosome assembly protein 1-like 1
MFTFNLGIIESLPISVRRRINGLKHFQSQHAELQGQFKQEVLALEKKYLELYRPLYTKRAEVVTGKYEPTDEEVASGEAQDKGEDDDVELIENDQEPDTVTGVPEFWSTVLKTHPLTSDAIVEADEEALDHLVDVRLTYLTDKPGFLLEFEFSENDYFTNTVLTKTYYYQDNVSGGDFVYDRAEGCVIAWKEGKDLTVAVETKKQRNKGTNKTRTVKRAVPAETFFNFFTPPVVPKEEQEDDDDSLDAKLEADYEMGEEFKEKIIPRAVDYFTGKALDFEGYDTDFVS